MEKILVLGLLVLVVNVYCNETVLTSTETINKNMTIHNSTEKPTVMTSAKPSEKSTAPTAKPSDKPTEKPTETTKTPTVPTKAPTPSNGPKVIFDYTLNKQLSTLDYLLTNKSKPYILLKDNVTIGDIELFDIQIWDIRNLTKSKTPTFMWTEQDNNIVADFNFGLNKMTVKVKDLKMNGKNHKDVTILMDDVFMYATQTTHMKESSCSETYSDFAIPDVTKVVMGKDVKTEEFNKKYLPIINKMLNGPDFRKTVMMYFDNCNISSVVNLMKLINEPYPKSSAGHFVPSITNFILFGSLWVIKYLLSS